MRLTQSFATHQLSWSHDLTILFYLVKQLTPPQWPVLETTSLFCIHDATLGADLAICGCRIDMVDGALERVDVACFNPNIEIVS